MVEADEVKARRPRRAKRNEETGFESPDPVEIAMKAIATGADRHGAARTVLEKHARLIDVQCEREHAELHILNLRKWTRYAGMLLILTLFIGAGILFYNASRARVLIVEEFQVPPALAERGVTGRVVSARILDRLGELQRATLSTRAEGSYANSWSSGGRIEIPETGISIDEFWRMLRNWLGKETRISGEVIAVAGGLAITTRAGVRAGGTANGPEAELDRLIEEAAGSIYRVTQPYRYAISLPPDRFEERIRVLTELTDSPDSVERKWAHSGLSVSFRLSDTYRAAEEAQKALAIDPNLFPALGNLGHARSLLGHDEAALEAMRLLPRVVRRASTDEYDLDLVRLNFQTDRARWGIIAGDPGASLSVAAALRGSSRRSFHLGSYGFATDALVMAHDYQGAHRDLASLRLRPGEGSAAGVEAGRGRLALAEKLETGSRAELSTAADRMMALADEAVRASPPAELGISRLIRARQNWPVIAWALAMVGRTNEAVEILRRTPEDCNLCLRARGAVAAYAGDRTAALHWLRRSVAFAPSSPHNWVEAGRMWLRAGERGRAIAAFEQAHRLAPRFADPLAYNGLALAQQGNDRAAIQRFEQAARYGPRWGALHLAWGTALLRTGDRHGAVATLEAAHGMDLSATNRARVGRLLAIARRA